MSPVEPPARLLVVGRIGGQRFAWPAASVERLLPMAAVTHVADLPPDVEGLLDVQGAVLGVVDPRPRLGLPRQAARPTHHLLLVSASTRYLLWVDGVDDLFEAELEPAFPSEGDAPCIARFEGQLLQVLSPAAFDPGPVVRVIRRPL